ncbi:MAG: DUF1501 domain-containing protein [Thermonemataceae bacterium]
MKRRNFIQKSALATTGTMMIPAFLKAFELQRTVNPEAAHPIVVIIQLSGGNDGLNTIIPYQNDLYYQLRPKLAIPKEQVISIDKKKDLGWHPALQPLQSLYDKGWLAMLNNVGYPNPDRSHFRSMDIWHTASDADEYWYTGWLGRFLDAHCEQDCQAHTAIEIDDTLSLALKGSELKGLAMQDPRKFYQMTRSGFLKKVSEQKVKGDNNSAYLYKTLAETVSSADYVYEKSQVKQTAASYPQTSLGRRLKTISQMIQSGLSTEVYYASLSGFDTHVGQVIKHQRLLKQYAEALKAFVEDLHKSNAFDQVLVLTFSEFGRRVKQNASNGTDHGAANNLFVVGKNLKKAGFYNEGPNLSDLDDGDIKYQIDFRDIYATLLKKHLKADDKKILGKSFNYLNFI